MARQPQARAGTETQPGLHQAVGGAEGAHRIHAAAHAAKATDEHLVSLFAAVVDFESSLTGLSGLPSGGHLIAAPYLTATQAAHPSGDPGTPLVNDPLQHKVGIDVKYTPNADNTLDGTIRPDFSQIESDTAQISTNQRFALFFPEKRPFFLEGVE